MNEFTVYRHFAAISVLILVGCSYLGIGITNIGDIVANPSRYEGTEVRIKGKVVNINKLPLVDMRVYTLRDGTGEIPVVAENALPALDSTVVVRGRVDSVAIIQGQSLGLRLTEIEKLPF